MSRANDWMEFLGDEHTDAWISRETGIPRSTVGFVRRGDRDLPSTYRSALRSLYQRDAYARLRDVGFSATQARRYSWQAPDTVSGVMYDVDDKIDLLADGTAIAMQTAEQAAGVFRSYDDIFEEARNKIVEGFRHSQATTEEWLDERY